MFSLFLLFIIDNFPFFKLAGLAFAGYAPSASEKDAVLESPVHIGIVFTQAGLGGNSFNDLAGGETRC